MSSREELRAEIIREEARLAGFQTEVDATGARLAALREQLASASPVQITVQPELMADQVAIPAPPATPPSASECCAPTSAAAPCAGSTCASAPTLTPDRRVLVSQVTSGGAGLGESLLRFHGGPIRPPQAVEYLARMEFVGWHEREVFRRPGRVAGS